MHFSKTLKSVALAGLWGLGFAAAIATPAQAEHSYTRCDRDGDRCWRVRCDWDGDDCREAPIGYRDYRDYRGYRDGYDPSYRYERRYYDPDRDRFYRYHHYDYQTGLWVCDGSSEYCRWSARR